MTSDLPPEIADLTPRQLLERYDGPGAEPCPPEAIKWLELARKLRTIIELRAENDRVEAELIRRRAARFGVQ